MSEYTEQVALFDWAMWHEYRAPELRMLFAIPNGEKRDAVTGARLKRAGVKPGVPDICLPVPRDGHCALWIELKAPGGRVRASQTAWIERLREQGHEAVVCVGWHEAARQICVYLGIEPHDLGL
jgi:hypothetical protein